MDGLWARNTKSQTPSSRENPGIETPKTKLNTPKKSQVPSSKPRPALRAWNWELGASLGVWSLVFGALIGGRTSPLPDPPRSFLTGRESILRRNRYCAEE